MDDAMGQPELCGKRLPISPATVSSSNDVVSSHRATGPGGPAPGLGDGPPRQRLGDHTVTALETDGPADAGDGVDDEPQSKHVSLLLDRRHFIFSRHWDKP